MTKPDLLRRALMLGTALTGGAILAEALRPREAHAAMTVIDPSNLAKNAETAAQTAQLVLSNKGILQTSEDMLSTIGMDGIASEVAGPLFNAAGGVRDVLGHVRKLEGAGRSLVGQIGHAVGTPSAIESVRAGITLAARYAANAAQAGGLGPAAEERARKRADTVRLSQAETMGAAMYHSEDAAQTANRISIVAQQARDAAGANGDLRGQVAVLTSAMLMQIEESAKQRQLIASLATQLALEGQQNNPVPPMKDGSAIENFSSVPSASNQVFGK